MLLVTVDGSDAVVEDALAVAVVVAESVVCAVVSVKVDVKVVDENVDIDQLWLTAIEAVLPPVALSPLQRNANVAGLPVLSD